MAFDVYVGSLTRYYLGDWENAGQRYARENGLEYQLVQLNKAAGEEESVSDPDAIRSAVSDWREVVAENLGENLRVPFHWDESTEAPWFTDRPAWEGYAALMLLAAYEENSHQDPPLVLPEKWWDDPAYKESAQDDFQNSEYMHILAPELWLPSEFDFTFRFLDLGGRQTTIGSVPRLLEQLNALNERSYRGTEEERFEWRRECPATTGPFPDAARFGLSIFLDLAEQAMQHQLPMKLDY